ncbi:origin recognition complex subunit 5 C-terminus-domain-containing protein [Massariosphaeria phaeospora]|uniref:Origin recognition complex subunit 5 C-terminus-domain-containing protein n=1 Tax=Massariosphaeria phaeospora TaxID=100035 RepID=A0A7C8M232_9PLEO|nr:origin recognition complex subunit 5 C-terminus-domain-containing protein [Massariosphaeria phaeospora]
MLPDEVLLQLNRDFPCRESQIHQLAALYSQTLPSPSLLVAHGLTATAKSTLVRAFLARSSLPHAIVNCRECITGRHLLEHTVAACLATVEAYYDETLDKRPFARTDSLSMLAVNLGKLLDGRDKFVLVLDGVDRLREPMPTLMSALGRFGEVIPNLALVLVTTLPVRNLHHPGTPHLHFLPYSRADLLEILGQKPPPIFLTPPSAEQYSDYTPELAAEDDAWLWNRFLGAVWDSLSKHTGRDLISFRNTATRLWRPFVEPVISGQFGTRDFSRLMVNRRHLFQLEDSVLDRIMPAAPTSTNFILSKPTTAPGKPLPLTKKKTLAYDLPYYTTVLLIAAYLASYNPPRTDVTYFMKHTDKRKNRRHRTASTKTATSATAVTKTKSRKIPRHLLTPSPFPLDRLLAVFRSLVDGRVPQVADVGTQIATLTSLRLLTRVGAQGSGAGDVLEAGARWRVSFGWEYARSLGRVVDIEVGEYLVGGVD